MANDQKPERKSKDYMYPFIPFLKSKTPKYPSELS